MRPRALLLVLALGACASSPWPDEPGLPVPASHADDARAADAFLEALTLRRAGTTLPAPTLTPQLQLQLRKLAEALERGETSASRARAEAARWAQGAYRRAVDAWVLDCGAGAEMKLPAALIEPPVVAIVYAAAHFRPRSLAVVQCAIIVVSARGGEHVRSADLGPRP